MTSLKSQGPHGLAGTRSLLKSLIELPDLQKRLEALAPQTFAALVRKVGVEDAGELIAFATKDQLVQAFDEDLFVSEHAGERESFDVERFVVWLEVLLEAGDEPAANRLAELDEAFVAHALSGLVLVLEQDALRERLDEGDEDEARFVDKSLESALTEELDGYILIAKRHDGWDAALSLILALDRDHRALLVRLLDRLTHIDSRYLDDLEELGTLLTEGESLAEDAEAAREERRAEQGYVEPRAARAFLSLARTPLPSVASRAERDPLTRAYFREVGRGNGAPIAPAMPVGPALPAAVLRELDGGVSSATPLERREAQDQTTLGVFTAALRDLSQHDGALFGARMEEFAYITNVLVAGHERDGVRLRAKEASGAALATVCYGAILEARAQGPVTKQKAMPTAPALERVLRTCTVDLLFRVASSALIEGRAKGPNSAKKTGILYSSDDLEMALR